MAKKVVQMAEIILTPKEREAVSKATNFAEMGNGSRLRDMVEDEPSFDKHTKIINEMLSLNQQHIKLVELQIKEGKDPKPEPVPKLKLDVVKRDENGQVVIERSLSSGKDKVFREVYNDTTKQYLDPGSCPRPTGIIPHFIPHNN